MVESLMRLQQVYRYYPINGGLFNHMIGYTRAVDGIDLELPKGKILGIVGESGCGKSSLARVMALLEKPSGGTIFYDDQKINDIDQFNHSAQRTQIQMVFQDPFAALNPRKRIIDIIGQPMLYHGLTTKQKLVDDVSQVLITVGLSTDALYRYPHEFSGGQRQRICIAKALSLNPRLLICDEPTSALDVSIQAQILNLLKSLNASLGLTIVFIAHGLSTVHYIADDVVVMYQGKIVEYGSNQAIFDSPIHDYTKALIAASPLIDPALARIQKPVLNGEVGINRYMGKDARVHFKKEVVQPSIALKPSSDDPNHCYSTLSLIQERTAL